MKEKYWVEYACLNSKNQVVSYGYAEANLIVSEDNTISGSSILAIKDGLLKGAKERCDDSLDPIVAITIHSWLPLRVR